jgi:tetratricopeptide (TPR) repeat protein
MWGVPCRNNLFTGREEQLTELHDKLFYEKTIETKLLKDNLNGIGQSRNSGIKKTEVGGIGGVGKTQLSIEYCHRHFGSKYGFVVMVRAESQASIAQEMRRLALDLGLLGSGKYAKNETEKCDEYDSAEKLEDDIILMRDEEKTGSQKNLESSVAEFHDDEVIEIIKRKLSRCRFRWLLVFDNVEDSSIISKYLPRGQLNDNFASSFSSVDSGFVNQDSMDNRTLSVFGDSDLIRCGSSTTDSRSNKTNANTALNYDCSGGGHVIITSRTSQNKIDNKNGSLGNFGDSTRIDSFDHRVSSSSVLLECFNTAESLKFLDSSLQICGYESSLLANTATTSLPTAVPFSQLASDEAKSLLVLADRMGNLPLALAMASAYLGKCDVTVSEYISRLDKLILYDVSENVDGGGEGDGDGEDGNNTSSGPVGENYTRYDNKSHSTGTSEKQKVKKSKSERNEMLGALDYSVVSSLSISLDRILGESEAAYSVLLPLGFLSPDGITKKLVQLLLEIIYFKTKNSDTLFPEKKYLIENKIEGLTDRKVPNLAILENKTKIKQNHPEEKIGGDGNTEEKSVKILYEKFITNFIEKCGQNSTAKSTIIAISTISVFSLFIPFTKVRSLPLKEKTGIVTLLIFAAFGVGTMVNNATTISIRRSETRQRNDENEEEGLDESQLEIICHDTGHTERNTNSTFKAVQSRDVNNKEAMNITHKNDTEKKINFISEEAILRETDRVWELLKQYSLLSVRGGRNNRMGSIHRLQQTVLRSRVSLMGGSKGVKNRLEECICAIHLMWRFDIKDFNTWEDCGSILNHIQSMIEHVRKYSVRAQIARRFSVILTEAALYSTEVLSRFDIAQFLLESAIAVQRKVPEYSSGVREGMEECVGRGKVEERGVLDGYNGKSDDVTDVLRMQILFLREKAAATHLLGKVFRIRGDFSKAEKNLQIALKIRKLTQSRKICDTLHELGVLESRQHEHSTAYIYLTDSLVLKQAYKNELKKMDSQAEKRRIYNMKNLENRNPYDNNNNNDSDISRNNNDNYDNNNISDNSNNNVEYMKDVEEETEINETSEAATLHQLAVVALAQASYDEAELLLLRALVLESGGVEEEEDGVQGAEVAPTAECSEKEGAVVGDRDMDENVHVEVGEFQDKEGCLAMRHRKQKERERAQKIQFYKEKIEVIQSRGDGDVTRNGMRIRDSVSKAATLQQLGRVHLRKGKLVEAKTRFHESLSLYLKAYGSEKFSRHINVAAVHHQLGCCYSAMQNFEEASNYFSLALRTREIVYGPEKGYGYDSCDVANVSSFCGAKRDDDTNDCGTAEIIQEIQALGQSEMMTGNLKSAEQYFLREFELCASLLNLKFSSQNNDVIIESRINSNISSRDSDVQLSEGDSGVAIPSNKRSETETDLNQQQLQQQQQQQRAIQSSTQRITPPPPLLSSAPEVQRKQESLLNSLLFAVYSLRSISNKRNNPPAALDYSRLARKIRKEFMRGRDCSTDSNSSKQTEDLNSLATGSSPKNAYNTEYTFMNQNGNGNEDEKLKMKNDLGKDESSITFTISRPSKHLPILLACRDSVRNIAISLKKGAVSVCVLSSVQNCLQNLKNNSQKYLNEKYSLIEKDSDNIHGENRGVNLSGTVLYPDCNSLEEEERDEKVLTVSIKFSVSCLPDVLSILDIISSSNHTERKSISNKSCEMLNSYVKNLFLHCDSIRSYLKGLGLKIEDS